MEFPSGGKSEVPVREKGGAHQEEGLDLPSRAKAGLLPEGRTGPLPEGRGRLPIRRKGKLPISEDGLSIRHAFQLFLVYKALVLLTFHQVYRDIMMSILVIEPNRSKLTSPHNMTFIPDPY